MTNDKGRRTTGMSLQSSDAPSLRIPHLDSVPGRYCLLFRRTKQAAVQTGDRADECLWNRQLAPTNL